MVEMAIRGCSACFQARHRYSFRTVAFSLGPIQVSFKGTHPSAKAEKYYQSHSEYCGSSSTPSALTGNHRRAFHMGRMPALERKWNEHSALADVGVQAEPQHRPMWLPRGQASEPARLLPLCPLSAGGTK